MEKLNRANCLREKVGSCAGCPVQNLALEELKTIEPDQRINTIRKISDGSCPKGNTLQVREKRPRERQSIWPR